MVDLRASQFVRDYPDVSVLEAGACQGGRDKRSYE